MCFGSCNHTAVEVGGEYSLWDCATLVPLCSFFCCSEPNSKSVSFEDTAYALNRAIEEFFPASSGVSLISEPGRFFVAESHILACNIYAKKMVHRQVATEIKEGGGHRDEEVVVVTAAEEDSCGKEVFDMDEFADLEGTSPMQRVTTVENPSQQHNVYYIDDGVYQVCCKFECMPLFSLSMAI